MSQYLSDLFPLYVGATGESGLSGYTGLTGVTGLSASPDAVWIYNSASNWTISSGNQVTLNGGFSAEL